MTYPEFQSAAEYLSKYAGSSLLIRLTNELTPTEEAVASLAGFNSRDDFEQLPVEEAGNDGVDEIVTGRHTVSASASLFVTPKGNDRLPTRTTFISQRYLITIEIPPKRPSAGTILEAFTGVKISNLSMQFGARGLWTGDLSFMATNRFSGAEWAALVGS